MARRRKTNFRAKTTTLDHVTTDHDSDEVYIDSEEILGNMGNPEFTDELTALLRIRCPLMYITSIEEKRLLAYFKHLSKAKGYHVEFWDCHRGLIDLLSETKSKGMTDDMKDPEVVLDEIIKAAELDHQNAQSMKDSGNAGNIFLLMDYHRFLQDALPSIERRLRRLADIESMTSVIVVAPHLEFTPATEHLFHVLDFPYPNSREIEDTIYTVIDAVEGKGVTGLRKDFKKRKNELIQSAMGLTLTEAQDAFAKSVIKHRSFDIKTIVDIKRQIIARKEILEYCKLTITMDDVGGLETIKEWFDSRKMAFSEKARDYGIITPPTGVLTLGVPGVGKSLMAKAIAASYEMPLLRLDFGRLFGSLLGESERTIRDALKLAEIVSPCILGNTKIFINGQKKGIENFFDLAFIDINNDVSVFCNEQTGEEEQRVVYLDKQSEYYTLGYEDGNIKEVRLKALIKNRKKGKLIKITTKSGKVIVVTKNHMLLDGNKNIKIVEEFKVGDRISIVDNESIQGDKNDEKEKGAKVL